MKKILILNNIGTPNSPSPEDVGIYLDEFLMDKDVIDLPWIFRAILVKLLIVPRRKFSSAQKYKSIWSEQGSPLMVHTQALQARLQKQHPDWVIEIGMRYGKPSMFDVLQKYQNSKEDIWVLPLFPQYAEATTGSIQKYAKALQKKFSLQNLNFIPPFYNNQQFIEAVTAQIKDKNFEHLLCSYHGLPESHVKKNPGCLQTQNCCERAEACAMNCYRAQCYQTTELIRQKLDLKPDQISTGFQSRLGRARWIGPSTESQVDALRGQGVSKLAVICPSFASDCLETLEEIGIELKSHFLKSGGQDFVLVPCVNDQLLVKPLLSSS